MSQGNCCAEHPDFGKCLRAPGKEAHGDGFHQAHDGGWEVGLTFNAGEGLDVACDVNEISKRRNPPPEHYAGTIEPWDYFASHGLDFWQATAVRYITRAGRKNIEADNALKDYIKARDYIDYLIRREEQK